MSVINKTHMRLPSLTKASGLLGLTSSRSSGALAAQPSAACTPGDLGLGGFRTPRRTSLGKQEQLTALGRAPGQPRRSSAPFPVNALPARLPVNGQGIDGANATCSASMQAHATILSPVREAAPVLPAFLCDREDTHDCNIDALSASIASMQLSSELGPAGGWSLGTALSSDSSLHSLSSFLSMASVADDPPYQSTLHPSRSDELHPPPSSLPRNEFSSTAPMLRSPCACLRRSSRRASMLANTSVKQYTFSARVPRGMSSEMITVYWKRDCRLKVVADAWHLEHDAHYEWEIAFTPADIDVSAVRVTLEGAGDLTITVPRRGGAPPGCAPPAFV